MVVVAGLQHLAADVALAVGAPDAVLGLVVFLTVRLAVPAVVGEGGGGASVVGHRSGFHSVDSGTSTGAASITDRY